MKLYKYLVLMFLLGMVSAAANATATDPGVILRGDGASMPVVGLTFAGAFPTPPTIPPPTFACPTDGPQNNCFQNVSTFTFVALTLTFDNLSLVYSCGDNSLDPFFTTCSQPSANEIRFSGLSSENFAADFASNPCGSVGCQGIQNMDHFLVGLTGPDAATAMTTYTAVADIVTTPEPASALLFVIGIGAIALFLKRA